MDGGNDPELENPESIGQLQDIDRRAPAAQDQGQVEDDHVDELDDKDVGLAGHGEGTQPLATFVRLHGDDGFPQHGVIVSSNESKDVDIADELHSQEDEVQSSDHPHGSSDWLN